MSNLPDEDLEALIGSFERSDWREMHLRMDGVDLVLSKDREPSIERSASISLAPLSFRPHSAASAAAPTAAPAPKAPIAVEIPDGWLQIKSPTLGTFYRSPKPGSPPFVEVGQKVTPDTDVCLVEVMKLFTTVQAGKAGTIRKVYPADAELVEFDQPLFLVEP
jgi:acetyl-CoA carboxylase biotin carboxyl carrier protein